VPTYDYKCRRCGYTFSEEQSILDQPLQRCKKCGGKLEKLLPKSINLIFRGSGFYVTDYKKGRSRSKGLTSEEPAAKAAKTDKAGGDKAKSD